MHYWWQTREGGGASLGYLCPYFDSSVDRWPPHPHWCSPVEAFLFKRSRNNNICCERLFTDIMLFSEVKKTAKAERISPKLWSTQCFRGDTPIQCWGKLTWYIVVWRFNSRRKVCVFRYGMSVVIQRWQLWQDFWVSWHKNRRQHYNNGWKCQSDGLGSSQLYALPQWLLDNSLLRGNKVLQQQ